ncbi:MAG: hypothetical protein RMZ41_000570 [Nostoc sp. DedVER02]|nr:hypothetical protein [Nostoc sp. DedVER01b]MDZ8114912.1 hypothetical protein [Nostoc sp. DedVER01b]
MCDRSCRDGDLSRLVSQNIKRVAYRIILLEKWPSEKLFTVRSN